MLMIAIIVIAMKNSSGDTAEWHYAMKCVVERENATAKKERGRQERGHGRADEPNSADADALHLSSHSVMQVACPSTSERCRYFATKRAEGSLMQSRDLERHSREVAFPVILFG